MHPILCNFHGNGLHSYGVLIAAGFTLGIVLAARQATRMDLSRERMLDLCFWILVAGLIGARALYFITNFGDYVSLCREGVASGSRRELLSKCTSPLHVWQGGLVFYGGLAGATVAVLVYTRRFRLPFLRTADVLAPSLALGHFFGRLGCYAAGCCWGKLSGGWGARFGPGSIAWGDLRDQAMLAPGAELTPPLHPTQLYEAGGELFLFFALLWLAGRKRRDGGVFAAYLGLYALLRVVVELYRGDVARRFVLELATPRLALLLGLPPGQPCLLSVSQAISLVAILAAVLLYRFLGRAPTVAAARTGDS